MLHSLLINAVLVYESLGFICYSFHSIRALYISAYLRFQQPTLNQFRHVCYREYCSLTHVSI